MGAEKEKEVEPLTHQNGKTHHDKNGNANGGFMDDESLEGRKRGKEEQLKSKIDEYVDGFTVHGLTRVFKSPRHESIFWFVVLIVGLLLAVFVLHTLITKYYNFQIYTEIQSVVTENNKFPSLSICEFSLLTKEFFSYCKGQKGKNGTCDHSKIPILDNSLVSMESGNWSNSVFDVIYCSAWGVGGSCLTEKYLESRPKLRHACFTWNYNGNFHDSYGHIDLKFIFRGKKGRPSIVAFPHDHRITEIDVTKMVKLDPKKNYDIKIHKLVSKRLPDPYPSKCVTEDKAEHLDLLPGAYSRRTCLESFQMLYAYKICGDSLDYVREFVPPDIKREYGKTGKVNDMEKCVKKSVKEAKPSIERCPFPCEELDLGITSTFNEDESLKNRPEEYIYSIGLQLQNVDSYTVMEEMPLYSRSQLTCEIGGFLGLVMGASLLSFIEIIFCSSLLVLKKFYARIK